MEFEEKHSIIGYEYKTVIVSKVIEAVYVDSLPHFGWIFEGHQTSMKSSDIVELRFKRDRKIRNKAELTRLQRQFDASVNEIISLEKAKKTKASIVALVLGLLGTVCIALATFSYLGGHLILMILFAIPGFLGWIFPYFSYQKIYEQKSKSCIPLIELKYDEIYEICEKANRLLGV